jgi:hypothetical protein
MALFDGILSGNWVTGVAIGVGAVVVLPLAAPILRPHQLRSLCPHNAKVINIEDARDDPSPEVVPPMFETAA